MADVTDSTNIEDPKFDRKTMFPSRSVRKIYKKYVSPALILDEIVLAESALISYLKSGGYDKSYIRVYKILGRYEQQRSVAIQALIEEQESNNTSFEQQWLALQNEIDECILEPMQNIGRVVQSVDFYRQDMERIYGKITDQEERIDMEQEIDILVDIVQRQCAEVKNNIAWLESLIPA